MYFTMLIFVRDGAKNLLREPEGRKINDVDANSCVVLAVGRDWLRPFFSGGPILSFYTMSLLSLKESSTSVHGY